MNISDLYLVLQQAYEAYLTNGARSTAKLNILHGYVAKELDHILKEPHLIYSKGFGLNKEFRAQGLFNEKNCDITLLSQDIQKTWKPVVTIPVKFPITNFKQNANNYFENMIGETVNLQSNNISVHHFIILPELLPYLNRRGEIARMECITNHDIDKYRKLMNELESANTAKPKDIFLGLLSFRGVNTALFNNNNITLTDMIHQMTPTMFFPTKEELLLKGFSQENSEFLVKHSNLSAFIKKIALQFNGLQPQKTGSDKKNDILYKQNN